MSESVSYLVHHLLLYKVYIKANVIPGTSLGNSWGRRLTSSLSAVKYVFLCAPLYLSSPISKECCENEFSNTYKNQNLCHWRSASVYWNENMEAKYHAELNKLEHFLQQPEVPVPVMSGTESFHRRSVGQQSSINVISAYYPFSSLWWEVLTEPEWWSGGLASPLHGCGGTETSEIWGFIIPWRGDLGDGLHMLL